MPTRACCAADLDDSQLMLDAALALDSEDEDEAELQEMLVQAACEPAVKRLRQEIGSEKLSLNRMRREAAEHGITGDDVSWTVYSEYGFHLRPISGRPSAHMRCFPRCFPRCVLRATACASHSAAYIAARAS